MIALHNVNTCFLLPATPVNFFLQLLFWVEILMKKYQNQDHISTVFVNVVNILKIVKQFDVYF